MNAILKYLNLLILGFAALIVLGAPFIGHISMQSNIAQDCAVLCSNQQQGTSSAIALAPADVTADPEPPLPPYYLAFVVPGYILLIVAAGYTVRILRWRPPDKLAAHCIRRV